MTPLPDLAGPAPLIAWRLDAAAHAASWDSGEGAWRFGGRWNHKGVRAVYCALDPACAILEVAAHKGFKALDTARHVLTALAVPLPAATRIVRPADVPNRAWLRPGTPGDGQMSFGDALLAAHGFVLIPSAVSAHSWNLIFDPTRTVGAYARHSQEDFALDTRLHPPAR